MTLLLAIVLLVQECGSCGNQPRAEAKYCDQCGRRLGAAPDLEAVRKELKACRYEKALSLLDPILDDDPRDFEALLLRGEARLGIGSFDLAADDARRAARIRNVAAPWILLSACLRESPGDKDLRKAQDALDLALKLEPSSPAALRERARVHLRLGESREALEAAERALKLDPKCADSYVARAEIRCKAKELAAALADYDRALELDPKYPKTLVARGTLQCDVGLAGLRQSETAIGRRNLLSHEERTQLVQDLETAYKSLQKGMTDLEESELKVSVSQYTMALRNLSDVLKELKQ